MSKIRVLSGPVLISSDYRGAEMSGLVVDGNNQIKMNPFKVANPFQMAWGMNRSPQKWSLSRTSVGLLNSPQLYRSRRNRGTFSRATFHF